MALSGWDADKKINLTIDPSSIDEDLTDFPVLINLGENGGKDGYDASALFLDLFAQTSAFNPNDKSSDITLTEDNMVATSDLTIWRTVRCDVSKDRGKWYWEYEFTNDAGSCQFGVCSRLIPTSTYLASGITGWSYDANGEKWNNGSSIPYGGSLVEGDIIGVALDLDNGKLWFSLNGVWQNSGDPEAGTDFAFDNLSGDLYPAVSTYEISLAITVVFKSSELTYVAPAGFLLVGDGGSNSNKFAIEVGNTGQQCYVEIENWEDDLAQLHVKVPSISSTKTTSLNLWYDSTHDDNTDYVGNTGEDGTYEDIAPHTMVSSTLGDVTVSASSEYSTLYAWKAFDGTSANNYTWTSGGGAPPHWLKIDFGSVIDSVVRSYAIQANTDSFPNRLPQDWTFEGSNNDSDWDVLDTVTGEVSWADGETRTFECSDTSTAYRYYRINISDENGDTYTEIGEFYIYTGEIPTQNVWDDDFLAVYHLAQDPSLGGACILDSTSNEEHGTPAGTMLLEDSIENSYGFKALKFDGIDDNVQFPVVIPADTNTVELSFNLLVDHPSGAGIMCSGDTPLDGAPYFLMQQLVTDSLRMYDATQGYHNYFVIPMESWNYCGVTRTTTVEEMFFNYDGYI